MEAGRSSWKIKLQGQVLTSTVDHFAWTSTIRPRISTSRKSKAPQPPKTEPHPTPTTKWLATLQPLWISISTTSTPTPTKSWPSKSNNSPTTPFSTRRQTCSRSISSRQLKSKRLWFRLRRWRRSSTAVSEWTSWCPSIRDWLTSRVMRYALWNHIDRRRGTRWKGAWPRRGWLSSEAQGRGQPGRQWSGDWRGETSWRRTKLRKHRLVILVEWQ